MAEPSIIEKLRRELATEITTERQVVYLLAEVRKLLELRNEKSKYFALNFYCCWALHTKMDQSGAERIVKRFDQAHGEATANGKPDLNAVNASLQRALQETMAAAKFRVELEALLTALGLPVELTQRDYQWAKFLSLYSEVIEECPLAIESAASMQHVKAVTVYKLRELPVKETEDGIVLFGIEWRLECVNPKHQGTWTMLFIVPPQPIPAV
ncbi:MAG: hypothetical protein JST93_36715 [Acidobacteria bacterium]|nr:hypothetical protein [Acidobacteriota bacterium]